MESFYKHENQIAQLYKAFALIAIFLSCLGLYGLASFMATQRLKEVGIRKVLGATSTHIVYLFSKEFILAYTAPGEVGLFTLCSGPRYDPVLRSKAASGKRRNAP